MKTEGSELSAGKAVKNVRVSRKEKILFLDAFGSLVNAGIPIVRAIQTIYFQSDNRKIRELAAFLKAEIETGSNMAKTAAKMPGVFSAFDVAMFEMGDATGQLGKVLETVTEREERGLELSRKVKQALIYPVAIAVIAAAMVSVIMVYVVPKIEAVYRESNANLPALTEAVIAASRFLRTFGVGMLLLVVATIAGLYGLRKKSDRFRSVTDRMFLRIPVFGGLVRKRILIAYCEFLASLLSSGVVINRALLIVKSGMGNAVYEAEIDATLADVKAGKPLSASMGGEYVERKIRGDRMSKEEEAGYRRKVENFPIALSTAVKVGEQTGTLAKMLEKAAKRYEREIDSLVKNLSSLLEPAVIVGVGSIVGVIVLAIMMPFFNMANVIR